MKEFFEMQLRVVIVGGGFGGLFAARALNRVRVQITLIDRRNFHLFQPLLYQVATGGLSPANIAAPLRGVLSHQKNVEVRLGEVSGFDAINRQVLLKDGARIGYDTLVVAAGAIPNYFGHDDWEAAAPALKSIADAREIRRRVLLAFEAAELAIDDESRRACLTFVVVGGGSTGVELAGCLSELAHDTLKHDFRHFDPGSARIILVEGGERILPPFPPELSFKAAQALTKLGVEVRTGTTVSHLEPGSVTLKMGDQSELLSVRTILWAAGVKASPLGKLLADTTGAQLDKLGRVLVAPDLTIAGHPDVFVIGDLADFSHQGDKPLPGVAQVAMQQGSYVAKLIQKRLTGKNLPRFQYKDRGSMTVIGRNSAVADLGWLKLSGILAWLIWVFVHLCYLVQFQNRFLVMAQWMWSYVTRNRSALLIPEESAADTARVEKTK